MIQAASISNTIIQSIVSEDKRARVMSYYTMAFFGSAPFGSLLAGALAEKIGASYTVAISGALCLAAAVWFSFKMPEILRIIQPIYQTAGLLPPSKCDKQPSLMNEQLKSAR